MSIENLKTFGKSGRHCPLPYHHRCLFQRIFAFSRPLKIENNKTPNFPSSCFGDFLAMAILLGLLMSHARFQAPWRGRDFVLG